MMLPRYLFACLVAVFACASAAYADPVTLRARIEASGPDVTLGDVFAGAGGLANRAIAPAPSPGQIANLPMSLLSAVASAAGLEFTAPAGVSEVRVVRPGGMRATLPTASAAPVSAAASATIGIRRGESVTLTFTAPGVRLSTRARALEDAGLGENVRLMNTASNRAVDAVVTGPGAAQAGMP
jgi:flagellar basal body P-ring formation protein FlgA